MFSKFALLALVVVAASALKTSDPAPSLCWADALPPGSNLPQIVLSMDCVDKDMCFIAGGSNGAGFGVFAYDGKIDGQVYQMQENNQSMITMGVVARGTSAAPIGVTAGVATFFTPQFPPFHYYQASSKIWQPSAAPFEFATACQSVSATKDGQTIVAVDGGSPSGFMVSSTGGKTFTFVNLTAAPAPGMKNCSAPGMIAVADANTWYLLIGQSPETPSSSSSAASSSFDASAEATISARRGKTVASMTTGPKRKVSVELNVGSTVASGETCIGYSAQIVKTTNGGATWTSQVTLPNADFSFNDIDCVDATTCIAVGSGDFFSNVYMMTDGTTWKQVFKVTGSNGTGIPLFNLVRFVNRSTIWIAGAFEIPSQQAQEGLFYFSKDGGKTFLAYPQLQPEVAAILALTFVDGDGFAAGVTTQQSSTVLKYADQPYYGYFEQVHCLTDSCNFLCESVLFPQGMCLQSSTGGLKAFCTPDNLEIKSYETTDCSGSFNTSTMPTGQCLNSTQGGPLPFFENVCNAQYRSEQTMGRPSQRRIRLLD